MTKKELSEILKRHKKWLNGKENGERANLSGADLSRANLRGVDLSGANLSGAELLGAYLLGADLSRANLSRTDLRGVNLSGANLLGANFSGADLSGANLSGTNLSGANLNRANLHASDLSGANLSGAKLSSADLNCIKYNENTAFYAMVCPEKGSFIGFKKASGKIVELMITKNAKRSSATTRKCRCSKAVVISITNIDGTMYEGKSVSSDSNNDFVYKVGETVSVDNFDENRWNECSTGIHFFMTRNEAVRY